VLSVLEELPDDGAGAADEELLLDGEDESELDPDVLPAPAEPLGVEDELELGELDEAPPLASFFCESAELDEELEPEPDGVALELDGEPVVLEAEPEAEPGEVAPEPEGVVELEEDAPPGALEPALSDLLQPAINAPPNARETARARVENFMWPPWLGQERRSKDRAANITQQPAARFFI